MKWIKLQAEDINQDGTYHSNSVPAVSGEYPQSCTIGWFMNFSGVRALLSLEVMNLCCEFHKFRNMKEGGRLTLTNIIKWSDNNESKQAVADAINEFGKHIGQLKK